MENPERHEITKQLNLLKNTVKSEDVLLIYYAGHGFLDQKTVEGYWLPADAEKEDDSYWISNNYVINKLKAMNAKNILLVSDSCFSGSLITRGIKKKSEINGHNIIEKFLNTQSRVTISSGGLKPVLDSGGGRILYCSHLLIIIIYKTTHHVSGIMPNFGTMSLKKACL